MDLPLLLGRSQGGQPAAGHSAVQLGSVAQRAALDASAAFEMRSQEAHQMKVFEAVQALKEGWQGAGACSGAVVECGFAEAGTDFAGTVALESLDRNAEEVHSVIVEERFGIVVEVHC